MINERIDQIQTGNIGEYSVNTNRPDIRKYADRAIKDISDKRRNLLNYEEQPGTTYQSLNRRERGQRNNYIRNLISEFKYDPEKDKLEPYSFSEERRAAAYQEKRDTEAEPYVFRSRVDKPEIEEKEEEDLSKKKE